jgi:hypothetical protein
LPTLSASRLNDLFNKSIPALDAKKRQSKDRRFSRFGLPLKGRGNTDEKKSMLSKGKDN